MFFCQLVSPSLKTIRFKSREVAIRSWRDEENGVCTSISPFSILRVSFSLLQVFSFASSLSLPLRLAIPADGNCWYIKQANRRFPRHILATFASWNPWFPGVESLLPSTVSRQHRFSMPRCAENRTLHWFLDSRTMFALSLMAPFPYKVTEERIGFQSLGYIKKIFILYNPRRPSMKILYS